MAFLKYKKEKEIFGYQTLFREIGYFMAKLSYDEKALIFFDEALKRTPNDIRALTGRSRSRATTCRYKEALEDIQKALELDPDNFTILACKAANTYLCSEFEDGLIQNLRLLPYRQKPDYFATGVMHCTDAIENCIGARAGHPLRDEFKVVRKIGWKRYLASERAKTLEVKRKRRKKKPNGVVSHDLHLNIPKSQKGTSVGIVDSLHSHLAEKDIIPPLATPFPFHPLQPHTTNIKNYMAEKYLERMYLDKTFLEKLNTNAGTISPNHRGSKKIIQIAKSAYKEVSYKQEVLRSRRPFYYIKQQEVEAEGALKERKAAELLMSQVTTRREAKGILAKIDKLYTQKDLTNMISECEKLLDFCDSKPKRLFPEKDEFRKKIFDFTCDGYYELNRINPNQYDWDQEKRIYLTLGIPISREPSTDSVVRHLRPTHLDQTKRAAALQAFMKTAEDPSEVCWCLFELCKSSIMERKWDAAKVYGKRCIQEGKAVGNSKWVVNATMLLAKVAIMQQNISDASKEINAALDQAYILKDHTLTNYLKRCLDVIEKIVFDDAIGPKIQEKRQAKIIAMISNTDMKGELAHIFRTMSAMPASRRMNIMPGVVVQQKPLRGSMRASVGRKMTISDKPKRESSDASYFKKKGLNFSETVDYR